MKTYQCGVYLSVIDIVEGRMIVTSTPHSKEREETDILIVIENELIEFGI